MQNNNGLVEAIKRVAVVNYFYCAPSGLSELRPALRISSVDNKLTAITELEKEMSSKVTSKVEVLTKNVTFAS